MERCDGADKRRQSTRAWRPCRSGGMVDAAVSKTVGGNPVSVRLRPSAPLGQPHMSYEATCPPRSDPSPLARPLGSPHLNDSLLARHRFSSVRRLQRRCHTSRRSGSVSDPPSIWRYVITARPAKNPQLPGCPTIHFSTMEALDSMVRRIASWMGSSLGLLFI